MAHHARSLEERFWAKVSGRGLAGCWEWTGAVNGNGYGAINGRGNGRQMGAHRVSWEMHFGPIPDGMFVCHACDNPPCVRPDHLFLGTCADNIADMYKKGRNVSVSGERHGQSKLDDFTVRVIRRLRSRGLLLRTLASAFGTSEATVSRVCARKIWRHVA